MLSQEEIDALLKGADSSDDTEEENLASPEEVTEETTEFLSDIEKDALGEIGNISMGTAATTLFTLLNKKVNITTPRVSITNLKELSDEFQKPFVAVDVKYKIGLLGSNILILKNEDVKIITDLMMGGDGTNIERELSEMDMSAISEAMNQMIGSSSTSLSEIFSKVIDIEPPVATQTRLDEETGEFDIFKNTDAIVKISFDMEIGDLIDSEIMQLIPIEFAKDMVNILMNPQEEEKITEIPEPEAFNEPVQTNNVQNEAPIQMEVPVQTVSQNYAPPREENHYEQRGSVAQNPVNVQRAQFQNFENPSQIVYNESIDMLEDVPIEITVELGRTVRKISEILEYGPGTIIELDKLVGEPLEIYANGKLIAKGEVVVIEDNFGVRINDIVKNKNDMRRK